MLRDEEMNQATELSQCLDCMNDGVHPSTQDDEIKDLVELASFVKHSYNKEDLPKAMIDDMVEKLSVELRDKKQKQRRHWLYGGLMGSAAAVLIFAFVQFLLPQSPEKNIAQQLDNSVETQNLVANTIIPQQVQSVGSTETSVVLPAEKKATNEAIKVIAEIIQVVEAPATNEKPSQVAMLKQEIPKDMIRNKSVLMATREMNFLGEDKNSQPEGRAEIMVLPNQTAQSITLDNNSGVIRQVYNQGTNDEIIITQSSIIAESKAMMREDAQLGEMQAVTDSVGIKPINEVIKDISNSVTVKIDNYYITIEGKKSKEELEKIAQSLVAKDRE